MAYALLVHALAQNNSGGATTASIDTTGANLLVVYSCGIGGTLTDSKSNTWTTLTTQAASGVNGQLQYCYGATVGSGHTFTFGGANTYGSLSVAAFSGAAASPFDQQNGANSTTGTSLATGSVTPGQDNELLVFGEGDAWTGTLSVSVGALLDSGAIIGGNSFATSLAYQIQTTATARNNTFSWTGGSSVGNVNAIATFKAAAGGGVFVNPLSGIGGGAAQPLRMH